VSETATPESRDELLRLALEALSKAVARGTDTSGPARAVEALAASTPIEPTIIEAPMSPVTDVASFPPPMPDDTGVGGIEARLAALEALLATQTAPSVHVEVHTGDEQPIDEEPVADLGASHAIEEVDDDTTSPPNDDGEEPPEEEERHEPAPARRKRRRGFFGRA